MRLLGTSFSLLMAMAATALAGGGNHTGVPEPATLAVLGVGVAGILAFRGLRRRK